MGAEILSRRVNWKDRSTSILFGDGAGAAVVSEVPEKVMGLKVLIWVPTVLVVHLFVFLLVVQP